MPPTAPTPTACSSASPMSTAAKISRSSTASGADQPQKSKRQIITGYTPGEPTSPPLKRLRKSSTKRAGEWVGLPDEILDKIVIYLASDREGLAVMLLSMVNNTFRQEVQGNLKAWHILYLHWRGHLSSLQPGNAQEGQARLTRMIRSPQGNILRLNPSVPRSLPNFQCKPPSIG